MPASKFRSIVVVAVAVVVLLAAAVPLNTRPTAAAEGDRRPNLQMLKLRDWHVETVNGRRLLRFTSIFVNAGPGPFEVHARRSSTSDPTMDVRQRMYRWGGGSRMIDTAAIAKYAADGHDHWHVQGVVTYEAWKLSDPADTQRRGGKTGFCFLDSEPWNLSIPYARQAPHYMNHHCGTLASTSVHAGLSVGWADNYPWYFAFQWIDITGLPGGEYRVRLTVDIQDYYDERVETDNCVWTNIRIPAPGSNSAPTVLANGKDCGKSAITPVSSFPNGATWNPPMEVSARAGVYTAVRYNSVGTVLGTRRLNVPADRIWTASARAKVPGREGRWFFMASGGFEGWWLREGPNVHLTE